MMNLDDIADQIIYGLDLNERVRLANMPESEFCIFESLLARYIAIKLKEDMCHGDAEEVASNEAHKTMGIVKRVWEKLWETHRIRAVK